MRRSRLGVGIVRVSIAVAMLVSTFSIAVNNATATGSCKFCVYSPFSNGVTTNTVLYALNCGSNANFAGTPSTSGGYIAKIYPESKACYSGNNNVYELNVSAGFNQISMTSVGGSLTARFYWNLSWDSTVTVATTATCTSGSPLGSAVLFLYGSIYDSTTSSYVAQVYPPQFSLVLNPACPSGSTSYTSHQGTLTPRTITISFTATSTHTYLFDSRIWGDVLADANTVTPTTGVGVDSVLNGGNSYQGQFSALQVW